MERSRARIQQDKLLFEKNGGHGMLFRTKENQLIPALHAPNDSPNEKAVFMPVQEGDGTLIVMGNFLE